MKKILFQKNLWSKKFLGPKILWHKNFWSNKFLVKKKNTGKTLMKHWWNTGETLVKHLNINVCFKSFIVKTMWHTNIWNQWHRHFLSCSSHLKKLCISTYYMKDKFQFLDQPLNSSNVLTGQMIMIKKHNITSALSNASA